MSIRDLRNHGGDIVDRAQSGEQVTITRGGRPVAELRPVHTPEVTAAVLLDRWRHLPTVDPVGFREDVDRVVDAAL